MYSLPRRLRYAVVGCLFRNLTPAPLPVGEGSFGFPLPAGERVRGRRSARVRDVVALPQTISHFGLLVLSRFQAREVLAALMSYSVSTRFARRGAHRPTWATRHSRQTTSVRASGKATRSATNTGVSVWETPPPVAPCSLVGWYVSRYHNTLPGAGAASVVASPR